MWTYGESKLDRHAVLVQPRGRRRAPAEPPSVYRGNPFIIEAGLAFGKGPEQAAAAVEAPAVPLAEGEAPKDDDELARVIRYANRVPLLYQQSACATFKAALETAWKNYGVTQSRGALPAGPMVIFVHMASVWVPFTSESKEAIADYDEIRKDIKLALQECGRRLGVFLRRRERAKSEFRRRNIFELYIEEVVEACARLKGGKLPKEKLKAQLTRIAAKRTGGARTDEILGKDSGPEGLPHSIIVTPEGPEGEAPELPTTGPSSVVPVEAPETEVTTTARGKGKAAQLRAKAPSAKAAKGKAPAANGKGPVEKGKAAAKRSATAKRSVTAKRPAAKRKKR